MDVVQALKNYTKYHRELTKIEKEIDLLKELKHIPSFTSNLDDMPKTPTFKNSDVVFKSVKGILSDEEICELEQKRVTNKYMIGKLDIILDDLKEEERDILRYYTHDKEITKGELCDNHYLTLDGLESRYKRLFQRLRKEYEDETFFEPKQYKICT